MNFLLDLLFPNFQEEKSKALDETEKAKEREIKQIQETQNEEMQKLQAEKVKHFLCFLLSILFLFYVQNC